MNAIKIKPIFLAVVLTNQAWAAENVQSESDDAKVVEEVVVTGFRGSLVNSMNAKRNATGVVDAIFAEDIAEFPDNNLAESLQRIPGVAISRAGGEGRQITVRGLGPGFTRVRINGMDAMSSTGGTDAIGGNNRGRGFDFNTFSSDLISNTLVRKTNSAEQGEGSLGATVDFETARPMDMDDMTLSVNGNIGYNEQAESVDPKLAVLFSKQFSDTFGALFSVSYADREILDEGNSTVRWENTYNAGSYRGQALDDPDISPEDAASLTAINNAYHPRIPRYDSYTHTIERTGLATTLQWQPTDVTDLVLDVLFARHDSTRNEIFMQGVGNSSSAYAGYNYTDYEIQGNSLVYGNISNADAQVENRFDELSTTFTQFLLSGSHEFSDRFRLNALLGTSKSEFENPIQNTLIARANGVGMTWDYRGDSADTLLTWGDGAYQESNYELTGIRQRPQGTNNEYTNASFDLAFDLNDSITFKGGLTGKSFDFDTYQSRYGSEGANGLSITGNTFFYDSGLGENKAWLVPDRAPFIAAGMLSGQGAFELIPRERDTYAIGEDTISLFAQMDFNTEFGDMPFFGNLGLQYFDTDQSSTGWFDVDGDGNNEQTVFEHSYDDILPSLNLSLEAMENVILRFSASEGITRAGLSSLRADQGVSVNGSSYTITGGNPLLEPTKATSFDFGVELYMSDTSMLSLTAFKKNIESHVQRLRDQKTPAELGIPASEVDEQCTAAAQSPDNCNVNALFDRSVPLNGPGGDLHGFEFQVQGDFSAFGDVGQYFGYIANYTYVKTQLAYLNDKGEIDVVADLTNLSDVTQSATFYFENDTYSARLAWVDRSDYLTDARGRNGNVQHGTYGTTNLDFSSSYQINDNFKLSFDINNLTNEGDDQWVDNADHRLSYYHETGTYFSLGLQYKL
ncbi:TonB-dependent receptor [Marinagarivorans cellulosilyticus]|uniref:TonB-dependent receptor n=1 Tax=Marinagarivorans cellulosilyticus TaxID=2721545 RepID=A0AAN1WJE2_9GAMM|nr:TonB-dependent receptor [Marinagarivorans cellulosilyticus]BCD98622.1 hypothetical protein MARGE09_P2823 [Marinagarivorans cellulosilyticus]